MLALYLVKNKYFEYREIKNKAKISKQKCRVRIKYAGICSSDIPRAYYGQSYFYPIVIGHEFSGVIDEVGDEVKKFKKGDRVTVYPLIPKKKIDLDLSKKGKYNLCSNYSYLGSRENGGFAEYVDVPEWNLYKIQKQLDLKLASIQEPTAVAFNVIDKIKKNKEKLKKIIIFGGGFISQIIIRILFREKMDITVIDRNRFKLSIASKYSSKCIKYEFGRGLLKLKNKQFDFVIDSIGSKDSVNLGISLLKPEGKLIEFGNIYKNTLLNKKNFNSLLRKELVIQGVWNSTFKSKKNNWKQSENFLIKYPQYFRELFTHEVNFRQLKKLFNKIYLSKKKKISFNYLKGLAKID